VASILDGVLFAVVLKARHRCAALIVNAGALSHYSYALADALATFEGVKVELHVSNPHARDEWRHVSVIAPVVTGTIQGFGANGYRLAVEAVAAALEADCGPDPAANAPGVTR
jgi:3-dehydroquinate dehydratase-2